MVQVAASAGDAGGDEVVGVHSALANGQAGQDRAQNVPELVGVRGIVLQLVQIVPKAAKPVHGVCLGALHSLAPAVF